MTSRPLDALPDSASGVLECAREAQAALVRAEVERLRVAVAWVSMHSPETIAQVTSIFGERGISVAGEGCPEVAEFAVPELALALGMSHDAGAVFLGDAVELAYRLPRLYARVLAGEVPVWRARHVAQQTRSLPPAGATFVDTHVAPVAGTLGPTAVVRLVEEALVRFDPGAAEDRRMAAAEDRRFDIHLRDATHRGTVDISGALDYADARDLDLALQQGAAELAALGNDESLNVRRSKAAGVLARRQLTLDLNPQTDGIERKVKARQLVLHVHLADRSVARLEGGGCLTVEQVAGWCTDSDTQITIKPILDLNAQPLTTAHEIPERMREQVVLTNPTCVFPHCQHRARTSDIDHIVPWPHGSTTPANLAPLCRRHHRLKTHGGWRYRTIAPGTYEWTTPQGKTYLTQHRRRQP